MGLRGAVAWRHREAVAGFPRSVWEAVGVHSNADFERWQEAGAGSPAEVEAWLTVVDGVDEAVAWTRLGVDRREVRAWRQVVASVRELYAWVTLGVTDIQDVHAWKAVCETREEVVKWRALGVGPSTVQQWRHLGVDPSLREQWAAVGPRDIRSVAAWTSWGFEPATARPWLRAGIPPHEAGSWHRLGFELADSRPWRKLGVSPRDAGRCKRAGVQLRTARHWLAVGYDLSEAVGWIEAGFDVEDVPRWKRLGVTAAEAKEWLRTFSAPDDLVPWLDEGIRDPKVARAWADRGRSAAEAKPWIALGFSAREAAGWMREAGLPDDAEPAAVAARAAAWRAQRFTPELCARWLPVVDDPAAARAWRRVAARPEAVAVWRGAGVDDPSDATALHDLGVDPGEVAGWGRLGIRGVDAVRQWRTWWPLAQVAQWCAALGCDLQLAALWRQVTHDRLVDAVSWCQLGMTTPEAAWDWVEAGHDPSDVEAWVGLGIPARADVDALTSAGLDAAAADRWRRLGVAPVVDDLLTWSQRWSVDDAERWAGAVANDVHAAWSWYTVVDGDLDAVRRWREAEVEDPADAAAFDRLGVDSYEAAGWARLGVVGADAVQAWRDRWAIADASTWCETLGGHVDQAWAWYLEVDGDLAVATAWTRAGVTVPAEVAAWRHAGYGVDEAGAWIAVGVTDRAEVEALTEVGVGPLDVSRWRAMGIPAEPGELVVWTRRWSVDEAERWCEAAGADAQGAWSWAEVVDHDLDAVAAWQGIGADSPDLVRRAADVAGDGSAAAAREPIERLVRAGLPVVADAFDWVRLSLPLEESVAWVGAGFTDYTLALAWRNKGFTPDDCPPWRGIVDQPGVARAWRRVVGSPEAAQVWCEVGVDDPQAVARLLRLEVDVEEAAGWVGLGAGDVDSIVLWRDRWPLALAASWCDVLTCDLGRAWWWHRLSNGDLEVAEGWRRAELAEAAGQAGSGRPASGGAASEPSGRGAKGGDATRGTGAASRTAQVPGAQA